MFPILAIPTALALWRMFRKDETYKQTDRIPSEFVESILLNTIDGLKKEDIWLTDDWYYIVPLEYIVRFTKEYNVFMDYVKDDYDCDNIATDAYVMFERKMPGSCFGFLKFERSEEGHQLNCFIDGEGKLRFVDLGNKMIFDVPKDIINVKAYI